MSNALEPVALRLIFLPRGAGATVRWEADIIGVRQSRMVPPIPASELALVLRALDVLQDPAYPYARTAMQERHFSFAPEERTRLETLGLWESNERVPLDAPRRIGRRLYTALTADPAGREALESTRNHATATGVPLAIELCFPPDAVRLAALPWELLWDDGSAPLLLGRGEAGSLTRRLDLPQALPPLRRRHGPLRILAVSPEAGISTELRYVERAARNEALAPLVEKGQAIIEELEPADRTGLVRALEGEPPDILHFYGHGRLRGGLGELLLDDTNGPSWVPAEAFVALLGKVGLVALYACEGASVGGGMGDPLLGGVAQALVGAGIPAVLGMQLAVRSTAASRAAAAIYRTLADGRSLQEGVAQARRVLFVEEADGASWYVPALYLRNRTGGPFYLREPARTLAAEAAKPDDVRQSVLARRGAVIRSLSIQGRPHSNQRVIADSGASIQDVTMRVVG
ncbi:CHAT domain-containing protein [Candidatus Chloroploca sp. M-50]|uniref:CHAT domain-containing protein n=1 Tax=Candidatus Chloroploca mongolica TaxID=2528176 RepID=A0ABS4D9M4_9CHLR|nr:CHAT domain-containing protein [Candidatus Chloroploca mongolica]